MTPSPILDCKLPTGLTITPSDLRELSLQKLVVRASSSPLLLLKRQLIPLLIPK